MQSSSSLNEQHIWGGEQFTHSDRTSDTRRGETTVVGRGRRTKRSREPSQGGIIASVSDDLFHPSSHLPTSNTFHLPNVPFNPNPRYNMHTRRGVPTYPLPHSSYNNPSFSVPPISSLNLPPSVTPLPTNLSPHRMGPPPPIPPRSFVPDQHFFDYHSQPAYRPFTSHHGVYPTTVPLPSSFYPSQEDHHLYRATSSPFSPSSSPLHSLSKTLPTVTHIPILTSKHDFFPWDEGVQALIRANGLIGHILDPSLYVDPSRPDLAPSPVPVLSTSSTPLDIEASNRWWAEDNVAQHILVSRLGAIPRGLLPSSSAITRTALSIYQTLSQYYGTCNFADCTELLNSLQTSACTNGRVPDFVSRWRVGLVKLQTAQYDFNIKTCISLFVRGLPAVPAFNSLRADLPRRIAAISDTHDYGAFIAMTETVLELDTIFRPALSQRQSRLSSAPSVLPPPPPVPPSDSTSASSTILLKKDLLCKNCKSRGFRGIGHIDATCFQPGGGMEGRRDEYMHNKGHVHAMLAECLEHAFSLPENDVSAVPSSPPISPTLLPISDSDILLPPIANLCVAPTSVNSDFFEDAYNWCELKPPFPFAFASTISQHLALLSMSNIYNTLLDSGCTNHIIRDRSLFHTYVDREISVGTANCGSLVALGTGDVKFAFSFGDKRVTFTLRDCLYAPTAPINLLSVGALVERGFNCLFSPGGVTNLFYPDNHPRLPGLTLPATVLNRLSFFNLSFLPPVSSSSSVAFPARVLPPQLDPTSEAPTSSFPRVKLDSMLWHRRFGHIGMDATRSALTKEYVTGVHLDGSFARDHCISCIVGKSPQKSYPYRGNRATIVGELLHMDLCGPFPVQAPRGEKYFFNILDDASNWGFTFGLRLKSDAFSHYKATEAFLERSGSVVVKTIRCGGELELTAGKMGEHFVSKGIVVQRTVPYAHQQNGKSERYIRTIEEGGQALLADAGLPMSFWLDAMLTRQYLVNRLPTSTLSTNVTPYEVLMCGRKPDLSHLRVWGCDCYVAVPNELRSKAGSKRYRAIFVGYEEHRTGWRVRDLHGKYSFSNDVIFNELSSGRLGVDRPLASASPSFFSPSVPRAARNLPRVRTSRGQAYDEVLRLKEFRRVERDKRRSLVALGDNGGDALLGTADALSAAILSCPESSSTASDTLSHSVALIDAFFSLIASSSFSASEEIFSLVLVEPRILLDHLCPDFPSAHSALRAVASPSFRPSLASSFDLSKEPFSYSEAIARPDAAVWRAAMDRECKSLSDMGVFEEADLPPGERTIGLKWVYAYKTDASGAKIPGKEKARLVAQGFNQRPGQFDETYAPVAKMASVRVLLTWAAVHDLEIFQFDCKTAFLHAKLRHNVYARPFPGFPVSSPSKVLRLLAALYGLRQAAYEFYMLIMSLFLDLGLSRCDVDHGVFVGEWSLPPDPSITMPSSGPLLLYVPLHVDDGLGITNSSSLYHWFLSVLSKRLHIVDLGPCSKFLSILIIRDRANRRLWLSSHLYVSELLDEWRLGSCKTATTPFPSGFPSLSDTSTGSALPDISDADLVPRYQRLVGCLLYLAIATRPDLSFYAMWLGQYNAAPTRAHFLIAKHVLRYLAGTKLLALCLGTSSPRVPATLSAYMQNVGCADADWASDTVDRKSISGYSFYFQGSLVSWSAVKQKSIALSSTEAEYYAMTHAFKEALWLRTFLTVLKLPVPLPFPILSDNQAACSLSHSPAISARSKHIDIRHHFIRDHVQDGSFSTTWIPTADMPADIFTKALPFPVFSRHRDVLGLSIPPSLQ